MCWATQAPEPAGQRDLLRRWGRLLLGGRGAGRWSRRGSPSAQGRPGAVSSNTRTIVDGPMPRPATDLTWILPVDHGKSVVKRYYRPISSA